MTEEAFGQYINDIEHNPRATKRYMDKDVVEKSLFRDDSKGLKVLKKISNNKE